jgi:F420-dependent oxidoreductase-like protein
MRFGYWTNAGSDWTTILEGCEAAAAAGWDGVWLADHFMPYSGEPTGPMNECWAMLAGLAATVPDVRVGAMVSGNTYRHPAVLLKQAVTTDRIAGGRVVLGLGAGWQRNEHVAYGLHFGTVKERLDRFEEACELIVRLRDETGPVDFDGRYYQLSGAPLSPRPVGRLPLMVGGGGEKRTLRTAARFADEWNVWGDAKMLRHKQEVLDAHCADVGRDPAAIQRSAATMLVIADEGPYLDRARRTDLGRPAMVGTPAQLRRTVADFEAAGVDELVIAVDFLDPPFESSPEMLERFQAEVAGEFR